MQSKPERRSPTTVILSGYQLFRLGMGLALNALPWVSVVGESDDPLETLELVRKHTPDLLFLQSDLDGQNTCRLLLSCRLTRLDLGILVFEGVTRNVFSSRHLPAGVKFVNRRTNAQQIERGVLALLDANPRDSP